MIKITQKNEKMVDKEIALKKRNTLEKDITNTRKKFEKTHEN